MYVPDVYVFHTDDDGVLYSSLFTPLPLSVAEKRNLSFVEPPDAIVFPFYNENVPDGATVSRYT